ncbi:unnamed protein product [Coregonus sp. 'balchen']|nr:unnamed protein product [Coregonus sp. 'balchen']
MFRKDPEKTQLVTEKGTMYSITMGSVSTDEIMQMEKDSNIKHCHDNSQAMEDREREKQLARKRLYVVSAVCLVFMIGEILGGYFAGSLAVMTDAAHLLVDFASFIISLVSLWLSSRPATRTLSYGWHRAEILGALLSVVTIWLVTGVLVYLAVQRLISGNYEIEGTIMLITSGCAGNHGHSHAAGDGHGHSHKSNHSHSNGNQENHSHGNGDVEQHGGVDGQQQKSAGSRPQANASVRAAFVHVVGDLLQSISVLVSAIIIFFKPEYKIADPICTFLFSIFVLGTTITIMRDILLVLMEDDVVDAQSVLREMTQTCFSNYNFHSVTLQLEQQADQKPGCSLCEDPKM